MFGLLTPRSRDKVKNEDPIQPTSARSTDPFKSPSRADESSDKEKWEAAYREKLIKNSLDDIDVFTLMRVFKSPVQNADLRIKAIDTIRCLCLVDDYKTALSSKDLGLLSTIFKLINARSFPFTKLLECLQALAKTKSSSKIVMASPEIDFLDSLVDEIRTQDDLADSVRISCSLLCTLMACDKRNTEHVVNSFLFADALNFIEAAGHDPSKWRGHNSAEGWSMYILMLMASHPELSAEALRDAGVGSVIVPLTKSEGLVGTMATVTMAFLATKGDDFSSQFRDLHYASSSSNSSSSSDGSSSSKGSNNSSSSGIQGTTSAIKRVLDLVDSALHRRAGNGYSESTFMLSMVTRAVRCLVQADVPMEISQRNRLLDLIVESIEVFISGAHLGNEPNEAGEAECMELVLDILGHILNVAPGVDVSALGPEGNPYHIESEFSAVMPYITDVIGKLRTCNKSVLLKGKRITTMIKAFLAGRKFIKTAVDGEDCSDNAPSTEIEEIEERHEEEEATPRSISSNTGNGTPLVSPRAALPKGAKKVAVSRLPSREKASTWAAEQCLIDKLKEIGFEVLLGDEATTAYNNRKSPRPGGAPQRCPMYDSFDRSKVIIVFLSPEYCTNESTKMEEIYAKGRMKQKNAEVIYLLMGDLWNREDLSLEGYLASILRGQTSFTLIDEESVLASFESIVASLGGVDFARQLKAEGSLSSITSTSAAAAGDPNKVNRNRSPGKSLLSQYDDEDAGDSVWGTVFTPRLSAVDELADASSSSSSSLIRDHGHGHREMGSSFSFSFSHSSSSSSLSNSTHLTNKYSPRTTAPSSHRSHAHNVPSLAIDTTSMSPSSGTGSVISSARGEGLSKGSLRKRGGGGGGGGVRDDESFSSPRHFDD